MVTPAKDSADDGGESGKDGDVACVRQHYCDTQQPLQAQCGISRIWVLNSHRRQNIASKLLDCVRCVEARFIIMLPIHRRKHNCI